jgi:hypothetical protein
MKICKTCEYGRVTQAMKGIAEAQKTTPDRLTVVYCLEERVYKDKYRSCEKHKISN